MFYCGKVCKHELHIMIGIVLFNIAAINKNHTVHVQVIVYVHTVCMYLFPE